MKQTGRFGLVACEYLEIGSSLGLTVKLYGTFWCELFSSNTFIDNKRSARHLITCREQRLELSYPTFNDIFNKGSFLKNHLQDHKASLQKYELSIVLN